MLKKIKVKLRPLVNRINLPTVIKSVTLPGETMERVIIATQAGEIFAVANGVIRKLLDIRNRIIKLGYSGGGYDERGLLGLAFHPDFYNKGLFYLHYSVAGTQGPGALSGPFRPNPCDPATLNLTWVDRENLYDHIDTVEEWRFPLRGQPQKLRTLLNLRRPFFNHNGVNSLNFSPETGRLVLTTGDGGSGFDPFHLSQNDMEIAGKIVEIDITFNTGIDDPPVVTRFDELPAALLGALTVLGKGIRNIPGISYQSINDYYMKYIGNVGQELVESIYAFVNYNPINASQLVQNSNIDSLANEDSFINLGWRGWEGEIPTSILRACSEKESRKEKLIAYFEDAIRTKTKRLPPLTSYYHEDASAGQPGGTALTGVQAYSGSQIPELSGGVVFTDFALKGSAQAPVKGMLAYTFPRTDCKQKDYSVIEIEHDFGSRSAYFTCLGTSQDQTRLYLGVYGSQNVTDLNQGNIYEIIP